ncbi:MAG: glycoside hydrolase family 3 protein [Gemmatimonadota bacterium]|nr:glycoside hydrolase family 3 protein [Gemmatimonadota bacterium]|tara:strand:- start:3120 stop:5021 length:1902 start_codon:yes stop_codon:yes gene_type:complete
MSTVILILSVAGCSVVATGADPNPDLDVSGIDPNEVIRDEPAPPESISPSTSESEARVEVPVPVLLTRSWAERTLEQLTIEEKAGQLLMPWVLGDFAPEGSEGHERIFNFIEDLKIGGLIMSVGTPFGVAAKLNALQAQSDLPLLVAADLETGAGFRMRGAVQMPGTIDLGGATDFPSLMAVGATGNEEFAYEMGRITAVEARALGVHVPFAPVLDVNNNPDNPIINVRSFGEDPQQVAEMGIAFVRGVQDNGAIATGKHFPGHGDTDVDSHVGLPVILHDRARMDSVELQPFRRAIDSGMGAIMSAHISVPSLNGGEREPSTLSHEVLTEILREELGFRGIVFTDAMDMSAVARQFRSGEAAVRALEAGADVILMPASVSGAIEGIVEAVRSGRLTEDRLDLSVMRVLETKENAGLHEDRYVSLEEIPRTVGIPEHEEVADQIARKSITLLKNGNDLLPLAGTRSARVMSVSYRRSSDVLAGRYFNRAMRETYPRLRAIEVDGDTSDDRYQELRRLAREQAFVVVGTYVTSVNVSGSFTLPEELVEFVRYLDQIGVPHTVVSFGNPYLVADFPDVRSYLLAWSGSEASQRAAAAAMLGHAPIAGRIPTRIPPFFEIGDGIQIPSSGSVGGTR